MSSSDLQQHAMEMESWSAVDVLAWGAARYRGRIGLATGFGPEGCVLIDLIGTHKLPIALFTLDTGLLFPETLRLWRQLEDRYGLKIRAVRPPQTVDEQEETFGPELWRRDPARCCELRKLEPLRTALAGLDAWVTAIRRDQTATRASARVVGWDAKFRRVKINPLVRWSSHDVWEYLTTRRVPSNPLHAAGYPSIGCMPCTTPISAGEDARAGRWRGHNREECGLHVQAVPVEVVRDRPEKALSV